MKKVAVVTGASSGIGWECCKLLAQHGWHVVAGARRLEKIAQLVDEIKGSGFSAEGHALDVADTDSVRNFCATFSGPISVLVNNAGGAVGLEPISQAIEEDWLTMFQSNVLGLVRVTRELLPRVIDGKGHIVNITSIAGREVYPNGAGYTSAKHAARVISQTLREELNGTAVRVTDIAPGLAETEFSIVRFKGDKARAKNPYQGITALTAADIAEAILWSVNRPWHVNIDEIVLKPVAQASAVKVARNVGL